MTEMHSPDPREVGHCEIRIKGRLDSRWAPWFEGLTLDSQADGTTCIHGPIVDQAALHGLLQKVRDTGLPLISVAHVEPGKDADSTTDPR